MLKNVRPQILIDISRRVLVAANSALDTLNIRRDIHQMVGSLLEADVEV